MILGIQCYEHKYVKMCGYERNTTISILGLDINHFRYHGLKCLVDFEKFHLINNW